MLRSAWAVRNRLSTRPEVGDCGGCGAQERPGSDGPGDLQHHRREIASLPDSGVPGELRADLAEEVAQLEERLGQENFYQYSADLSTRLTAIKARVRADGSPHGCRQEGISGRRRLSSSGWPNGLS